MNFRRTLALVALMLMMIRPSWANDLDQVKKNFQQRFPQVPAVSVAKTPVPGIFEVAFGQQIIYTDRGVHYLFVGNLIDAKTRRNLTESRLRQILRVDFSKLPLADAIKVVHGDGKRVLAVFSDPDCPFCKQLEHALQKVPNTTVYTFLYPIDALHPGASAKARAIWCAPDRAKAWEDHMLKGTLPNEPGSCANPVDRNQELGKKLGVNATPTMILQDGRMVVGFVGADKLEELLAGAATAAHGASSSKKR